MYIYIYTDINVIFKAYIKFDAYTYLAHTYFNKLISIC